MATALPSFLKGARNRKERVLEVTTLKDLAFSMLAFGSQNMRAGLFVEMEATTLEVLAQRITTLEVRTMEAKTLEVSTQNVQILEVSTSRVQTLEVLPLEGSYQEVPVP